MSDYTHGIETMAKMQVAIGEVFLSVGELVDVACDVKGLDDCMDFNQVRFGAFAATYFEAFDVSRQDHISAINDASARAVLMIEEKYK